MNLVPFERAGDTPFTATSADIVSARGRPLKERRNEVGLNELDYGDVVFRFQDGGRLEEITLQAAVVNIGNVAIPFENLATFVRAHDSGVFERAGFLVSPAYGLAFDPREPHWLTALARHCIPQWEALRY